MTKKNLFILLLSALSLTAVAQQKKTVAVLDPICRDNSVNVFFQQMVRGAMESAVTTSNEYEAYDRSAFDQIQKEQAFQRTGAVNDSQIKKMGEMAGVDYVLVSEVSAYEGYLSTIIKILNVTTGKYDRSIDDFMELKPEAVKTKCKEMATSLFGKDLQKLSPSSVVPSKSTNHSQSTTYKVTELYQVNPRWAKNPTITDDCIINLSIMHEAVKKQKWEAAEPAWRSVYENCPNANKSIYTDGEKILRWLIEHSTTDLAKKNYVEMLIELYDKRIFYFGDDSKFPIEYILGEKGLAYLDFYGNDKLKEAYACLQYSVKELGLESSMLSLVRLVETSCDLYKQNPYLKDQFITDYEMARKHLVTIASNLKSRNAEEAAKQVAYIDNIFANSRAIEK